MRNAKVYHGGAGPGGKFSSSGGGGSGTEIITLLWVNNGNLTQGTIIPAPINSGIWSPTEMGYYFSEKHTLLEINILFNSYTALDPDMDITVQLRKILADGTNPAPVVVAQVVTQFPLGFGDFFGNANTALGVAIPAGYQVYAYVSGLTATDVIGVSIWGRFSKG